MSSMNDATGPDAPASAPASAPAPGEARAPGVPTIPLDPELAAHIAEHIAEPEQPGSDRTPELVPLPDDRFADRTGGPPDIVSHANSRWRTSAPCVWYRRSSTRVKCSTVTISAWSALKRASSRVLPYSA